MDSFEKSLEENFDFEFRVDEDPNTFEEFLDPEEYIELGHLFTTDRIFSSKDEFVHWEKQTAMNAKTYLIITRYQRSRTADWRPYVTLAYEHGGSVKKYKKAIVDEEEEEAARLTEEQLHQTEQFRKSHVPPLNILRFFREQDVSCVVRYNMPLLEAVEMTPTGKNFTVATAFMCNEQATIYRWVLQQIKHLYFTFAMSNGQGSIINEGEPLKIMDELKKAREMVEEPGSNCLHYLRKSHDLPCAC
ncbi:hypothetical protein M9H77_13619 [Catharanthus roseus]|uniref:Uncharacterized protein n=1 Tax=Catharanthus roseus TaxID=4058 RepID=A0ACC0BKR9_CATRO|nr:hypothetical protein M9H77_13619 [Catharanthus roseus]